jgi:hypothetical protein
MSFNCAYHPEREAHEKCENCNKIICLECKKVYQFSTRHRYAKRYELCTPCYYDRKIKTYKSRNMGFATYMIISAIVVLVLSMTYFDFSDMSGDFRTFDIFFKIFVGSAIAGSILFGFVYTPRKIKECKLKKEEFLKTVQPTEIIQ